MRRRDFTRATWALIAAAIFGATVGAPDAFFVTLSALAGAMAAMARGREDDER